MDDVWSFLAERAADGVDQSTFGLEHGRCGFEPIPFAMFGLGVHFQYFFAI